MPESWYLMDNKPYHSGFEFSNFSDFAVDGFNELLELSPEAYDVLIEDNPSRAIIQSIKDQNDEKRILVNIGGIDAGNIIVHKDKHWLIVTMTDDNRMYEKASMKRCYTTLRWQDESFEIREAWFTTKSDISSSSGINDGIRISSPGEERQIIIQSNEHTQKLSKTQKFIFSDRAWKIVSLDDLVDGIIQIVLEEDLIDPAKDNLTLRVANYIEVIYLLKILNGEIASIQDTQSLQMNIEVSKNGILVDTDEVLFVSSDESIATINNTGLITPVSLGQVDILVSYKTAKAQMKLTIREIHYNNYTVDIVGAETLIYSDKATYEAIFKNNGLIVDETAIFSLLADDNTSITKYATLKLLSDNKCELVGSSNSKNLGFIQLHVKSSNGLCTSSKRVKIKGFI